MPVTSAKSSLHPRRWHPATWVLFVVWLTAAGVLNFPYQPTPDQLGVGGRSTGIVYIGLPMWYREHEYDPTTGLIQTTTYGSRLLINIALGMAVQLSIIIVMQRIQRFSMKTMLLGVFLVTLLLTVGKAIDARYGFYVVYFMIGIYLLPLFCAATVILISRAATKWNATKLA